MVDIYVTVCYIGFIDGLVCIVIVLVLVVLDVCFICLFFNVFHFIRSSYLLG